MPRDPASYRDPAGHVHLRDGKVYRSVLPPGAAHYGVARASGFLEQASRSGLLIEGRELDPTVLHDEAPDAVYLIEHPCLDFISYPYEWSFPGLQKAALLTLDLHLEALSYGLTLSDGSAYNVQFIGPRPVFIDYLSLIPYETGQMWLGYRQFCEQFLNPLLLTAKTGVAFQPVYRGTLEGLASGDLAALLPTRSKFDPRIALHVGLQAKLQRAVTARRVSSASKLRLSKTALQNNLRAMRSWVAKLRPPASQHSPWQHYEQNANYSAAERSRKSRFVAETVAAAAPKTVWALGCNSGEFEELALRSGAQRVIGFEPDPGALNAAYQRAVDQQLQFLPLSIDLVNPSPALGWLQRERLGLAERRNADMVFCLALLHHLVLGRNLPLGQVLEWVVSLAPRGVIEFVPKDDPMAKQLLALKPDIAPEYTRETFTFLLRAHTRIEREETVTESGRALFSFTRI